MKKGFEMTGETEISALRARLEEAEETLDAIRQGQVEALLVTTPEGPKVFTLEGADHRYRRLVETMNEGALLVSSSGLIVYSNAAFAAMAGTPLELVAGRPLADFVDLRSRPACVRMLGTAATRHVAEEVTLRRGRDEVQFPARLSMSPNAGGDVGVSVIVTDLTAQKRNEEIVASERLANSILEQAAEAIVVCDADGVILRASGSAWEIAAATPLRKDVYASFPLRAGEEPAGLEHPASRALGGEVATSVEMSLRVPGRAVRHLLCSAAPLLNHRQEVLGCVMSMTDITRQKQAGEERLKLLEAERSARTSAERARTEAEASNRSKDEFLATVSHELRTPLNAIVGWSRLLSDGDLAEDRKAHAVAVIRRNADAQARLIEDLLDVSRIVSGQLRLDVQSVEPARLIRAVLESIKPAVDAKGIRLEVVLDSEDATVLGDENRLQQIIWNLLSNAAKFTPRQGKIRVTLQRVDSTIEIVVSDNGRGISADFLPYVFDRFRQADGGIDRAHGGLGLGLAISRHLVELHGGSIGVTSAGPDRGTTFTVRLPRAAVRASPVPITPPPPSVRILGSTVPLLAELHDLHVLIVEDDEDSRDLLTSILRRCGARVTATDSGHEALAVLGSDPPHVLVSDIGMAKMDGYTLIRRVRELPMGPARGIPALALTAFARPEDRRRALAEGFQMHLAKPVDPSELVTAVASLSRYGTRTGLPRSASGEPDCTHHGARRGCLKTLRDEDGPPRGAPAG